MPVTHNLFADLNLTKEAFDEKKKADPRLSTLHEQYNKIDTEVLEAESGGATDDQITKLRKKRLKTKDEIVQHLKP